MLTPEAIARHVKRPYSCPYCNDEDIRVIDRDWGVDVACRKCQCKGCNLIWVEVFQLTDVEEGFD